jgi:hypothetical protein
VITESIENTMSSSMIWRMTPANVATAGAAMPPSSSAASSL